MKDQVLYMLGLLDADFVWECKQIYLKKRIAGLIRDRKEKKQRQSFKPVKLSKKKRRAQARAARKVIASEEDDDEEEGEEEKEEEDSKSGAEEKVAETQEMVMETDGMEEVVLAEDGVTASQHPEIKDLTCTPDFAIFPSTAQPASTILELEDNDDVLVETFIDSPALPTCAGKVSVMNPVEWNRFKSKLLQNTLDFSLMKLEEVFSILCFQLEASSTNENRLQVLLVSFLPLKRCPFLIFWSD